MFWSCSLLVAAGFVTHHLDLGIARWRSTVSLGALLLAFLLAAGQLAFRDSVAGILGIAVATVGCLAARRIGHWLAFEGGAAVVALVVSEAVRAAVPWTVDTLLYAVAAIGHVLSPPRTYEAAPVERAAPVPVPSETAVVRLPSGDRWGLLGPAAGRGETAQVSLVGPALTAVETGGGTGVEATYEQWLPTCLQGLSWSQAAAVARDRYGVARSTFARHVAKLRADGERAAA